MDKPDKGREDEKTPSGQDSKTEMLNYDQLVQSSRRSQEKLAAGSSGHDKKIKSPDAEAEVGSENEDSEEWSDCGSSQEERELSLIHI